jgi:hypothetical protein
MILLTVSAMNNIQYNQVIRCKTCRDIRWVCESHIRHPWGDLCCEAPSRAKRVRKLHHMLPYRFPFRFAWCIRVLCKHGACHCGGAGYPCPGCNSEGNIDPGWVTVLAKAE